MARISILGAGAMGSALAYPLRDNWHEVRLVGTHLDDTIIASCKKRNVHPKHNRALPDGVQSFFYDERAEGLDGADVIVLGIGSRGVQWAGETLAPLVKPNQKLLMITKGLWREPNGDLRIFPDLIADYLPEDVRASVPIAAIGGPSIAGELAARRQMAVVFTCRNQAALDYLAPLFATDYYHIWTSTDIVGVEVCVALKNIYALGVGLVPGMLDAAGGMDGNAAMHNHAAAFFAQGLTEMARLVQHMGGDLSTVFSLPGAGDLYVTCQGGRNSRMGRLLGRGVDPEEANHELRGETVEGVDAVAVVGPAITALTQRGALERDAFPLLHMIHRVAVAGGTIDNPMDAFFRLPSLRLTRVTGT